MAETTYPSRAHEFTPSFSMVSVLLIFLVFCVFTFLVPCCDVRYDFHIKTMFGSSLPPVVRERVHIYVCLRIAVSNIQCCVFLFCLCSSWVPNFASFSGFSILNCPFGFSNVYERHKISSYLSYLGAGNLLQQNVQKMRFNSHTYAILES